jgi:hypothetical protein
MPRPVATVESFQAAICAKSVPEPAGGGRCSCCKSLSGQEISPVVPQYNQGPKRVSNFAGRRPVGRKPNGRPVLGIIREQAAAVRRDFATGGWLESHMQPPALPGGRALRGTTPIGVVTDPLAEPGAELVEERASEGGNRSPCRSRRRRGPPWGGNRPRRRGGRRGRSEASTGGRRRTIGTPGLRRLGRGVLALSGSRGRRIRRVAWGGVAWRGQSHRLGR